MDLFLGVWSSFCQSLCFSYWLTLGFTIWEREEAGGGGEEGASSQLSTSIRCTFPRVVVPVGLGERVGDRHDAAVLQKEGLFFFLVHFWRRKLRSFYGSVYCDAYLVGTTECAFWEGNTGRKKRKTTLSPLVRRFFFWLTKGPFSFSGS